MITRRLYQNSLGYGSLRQTRDIGFLSVVASTFRLLDGRLISFCTTPFPSNVWDEFISGKGFLIHRRYRFI